MRIEQLLNLHYEEFGENEKYVCHYLAGHWEECRRKSLEDFARNCGVSKTLLVRFAKKLGLSGYSELKARLAVEAREKETPGEELLETVTDSYHKMMDSLVKKDLRPFFERLHRAERVFVYGSGSSQTRAASEMKRIFLPAREIVHLHGHDMCGALKKIASAGDMVIMISLSGESEAVVELARALRVKQVDTASITRLDSNTLASVCTDNLYIHSVQMPVGCGMEYEITTPYFILIEFLYLSYQNYLASKEADGSIQSFKK